MTPLPTSVTTKRLLSRKHTKGTQKKRCMRNGKNTVTYQQIS